MKETQSSQAKAKNKKQDGGADHAHYRLSGGGGGADIGGHCLIDMQGKANNAAAGSEGDGMIAGGRSGSRWPITWGIGCNGLSGAINIDLNRSTGASGAGEGRVLALVPPFAVLIAARI